MSQLNMWQQLREVEQKCAQSTTMMESLVQKLRVDPDTKDRPDVIARATQIYESIKLRNVMLHQLRNMMLAEHVETLRTQGPLVAIQKARRTRDQEQTQG